MGTRKLTEEELKSERTCIYDPEYVKENDVKCINCKQPAKVTFYDGDWNGLDLCDNCYKKI